MFRAAVHAYDNEKRLQQALAYLKAETDEAQGALKSVLGVLEETLDGQALATAKSAVEVVKERLESIRELNADLQDKQDELKRMQDIASRCSSSLAYLGDQRPVHRSAETITRIGQALCSQRM